MAAKASSNDLLIVPSRPLLAEGRWQLTSIGRSWTRSLCWRRGFVRLFRASLRKVALAFFAAVSLAFHMIADCRRTIVPTITVNCYSQSPHYNTFLPTHPLSLCSDTDSPRGMFCKKETFPLEKKVIRPFTVRYSFLTVYFRYDAVNAIFNSNSKFNVNFLHFCHLLLYKINYY